MLDKIAMNGIISTHSLTKRLTLDQYALANGYGISTHSLTKRLTFSSQRETVTYMYFNSQPHEEADGPQGPKGEKGDISTHSLTKRLTGRQGNIYMHYAHFNSQPHEEADSNFAQKFPVQNCIFVTIIYIVFSVHLLFNFLRIFFFLNLSFCRCEYSRESCVLNFRTYNIKVSVTSKPGLAPICSTLFLYSSPK